MHKLLRICVLLTAGFLASAAGADSGFSEPATAEDIERVYWSIFPDGENLPEGSGAPVQGKPLYDTHCVACHGLDGEGTLANQLVGGRGTLDSDTPVKTIGSYWPYATTVFNYIRRAMPYTAPMSLTNEDYYAITAYLLNRNDIIAADVVIDKDSLPTIQMPNRDGFVNAYPDVPKEYDYSE
jgi:cytochrome c